MKKLAYNNFEVFYYVLTLVPSDKLEGTDLYKL